MITLTRDETDRLERLLMDAEMLLRTAHAAGAFTNLEDSERGRDVAEELRKTRNRLGKR